MQLGGKVPKELVDFILTKPTLRVPMRMACALFTGKKVNLGNSPIAERDGLRDAYFISAIWRLLGVKIVEKRKSAGTQLALLNAVYVGAGQPHDQILDDRQTDPAAQHVALPQTTLRGEPCTFEPDDTLGSFRSCLRYSTRFTATATDLNPGVPWHMELYAADLQHYAAARNAHRQRIEAAMWKFDMRFQPATKSLKDLESRGVTWRPNEIWDSICVVDCVLAMEPGNLFGYTRLGFYPNVPYEELSSTRVVLTDAQQRRPRELPQWLHSHRRRLEEERVLRR